MLVPDKIRFEFPAISVTPLTLEPIFPLMVVAPKPAPELVIVPVLLTVPVNVIVPRPLALSVRFPVLVKLPLSVELVAAWFQMIADGQELPRLEWKLNDGSSGPAGLSVKRTRPRKRFACGRLIRTIAISAMRNGPVRIWR